MTNFPEQLVRRVAESDPFVGELGMARRCFYCGGSKPSIVMPDDPAIHKPDCQYVRAREWVKRKDAPPEYKTFGLYRYRRIDGGWLMDEQNTGDESV